MEISGIIAAILVSFGAAFLFARFLLWFDRYEKEPFWLVLGVFLWGALIAGGGAFLINTIFGLGVYLLSLESLNFFSSGLILDGCSLLGFSRFLQNRRKIDPIRGTFAFIVLGGLYTPGFV